MKFKSFLKYKCTFGRSKHTLFYGISIFWKRENYENGIKSFIVLNGGKTNDNYKWFQQNHPSETRH